MPDGKVMDVEGPGFRAANPNTDRNGTGGDDGDDGDPLQGPVPPCPRILERPEGPAMEWRATERARR